MSPPFHKEQPLGPPPPNPSLKATPRPTPPGSNRPRSGLCNLLCAPHCPRSGLSEAEARPTPVRPIGLLGGAWRRQAGDTRGRCETQAAWGPQAPLASLPPSGPPLPGPRPPALPTSSASSVSSSPVHAQHWCVRCVRHCAQYLPMLSHLLLTVGSGEGGHYDRGLQGSETSRDHPSVTQPLGGRTGPRAASACLNFLTMPAAVPEAQDTFH